MIGLFSEIFLNYFKCTIEIHYNSYLKWVIKSFSITFWILKSDILRPFISPLERKLMITTTVNDYKTSAKKKDILWNQNWLKVAF